MNNTTMTPVKLIADLPYSIITDTDSYKLSHWLQYVEGTSRMMSYLEARGGELDSSTLFGLQYVMHKYLSKAITQESINCAEEFALKHGEPFNKAGWEHILKKYDGKLPVTIRAVPEGTVVPVGNALLTIECDDPKCFWVASWLETMLVRLWYPSTIAMASRESKKILLKYLKKTSDEDPQVAIMFKLHDFGARGVACLETARLGGSAHLLSFLGSDTISGIELANHYYYEDMAGFSIPACYDDETEILTDIGFIPFSEVSENNNVAQYHDNGDITFVKPTKIHSGTFKGDMITFNTKSDAGAIDCVVTPNHRMVRRSIITDKLEVLEASEFNVSHRNVIPQAGKGCGGKEFSKLDALRFAFQADGSFVSRADKYTGEKTGCKPIRFSLKKERKQNRLREICSSLKFEFSESKSNGYIHFWIKVPLHYEFTKDLGWVDFKTLSLSWCKDAIEEISKWDGQKKFETFMFHSSDYHAASIVQGIGVLAGWRSSLSTYEDCRGDRKAQHTVCICSSTDSRNGQGVIKGSIEYDGQVYCVTVPSGMLIIRRNGKVIVSGNSEHSTVSMWQREREYDMFESFVGVYLTNRETPEGVPKLAACVSDTFNVFEATNAWTTGNLKEKIKASGGTLVIRPDSGDPREILGKIFAILEKNLAGEITTNSKGYKVLPPWIRVIQGDGITRSSMKDICIFLTDLGWSLDNYGFGSGGGLLQMVNRDTQKWAFKCCAAMVNGKWVDVRKNPITDQGKRSKAGRLDLILENGEYKTVALPEWAAFHDNTVMQLAFRNGDIFADTTFAECRERMQVGL